MADRRTGLQCPRCGSADTPRLIVRGNGADAEGEDGVALHCRACHFEWSEDPGRRVS